MRNIPAKLLDALKAPRGGVMAISVARVARDHGCVCARAIMARTGEHYLRIELRTAVMSPSASYWKPVCDLVARTHYYVRAGVVSDVDSWRTHWGQMLVMPVEGYLEPPGGPVRTCEIEWVDIAPIELFGGMLGLPRRLVDRWDSFTPELTALGVAWEVVGVTGVGEKFGIDSIRVAHLHNPFFQPHGRLGLD